MENMKQEKSKKKKSKFAMFVFIFIFVGLAVFGIYHFSASLGGIPSGTKVITDDNMQDFINEQKEQGVDVIIEN